MVRLRAMMNDDGGITIAAATEVHGDREARRLPKRGGVEFVELDV